ncbi:hypothetical protein TrVE_jg8389 [Triparma verrucosa]|uniref:Uncharacterized protein n=1 Tax=Triparma verrucosa TaxID=1606542 RepID=A0A9W7F7R3_9STRA|nr:hypothetical protein TrVE_jg8389 [Triparma verrucosa]
MLHTIVLAILTLSTLVGSYSTNSAPSKKLFKPLQTSISSSRRSFFLTVPPTLLISSSPAFAAPSKALGASSASSLRSALSDLQTSKKFLDAKKYSDLSSYLSSSDSLNTLSSTFTSLVQSRQLTPEDTQAIGTIRTYGVAADVQIMYGGLMSALEGGDGKEIQKYWKRTEDSLKETVVILESSNL